MKKIEYEVICCIVNEGNADNVMDAAKSAGATGGTVLKARGTANKDAEQFFKIAIDPQKEMVMILAPIALKEDIMHALYTKAGLNTPGQGITFSLPVDNVAGLNKTIVPEKKEEPKEEPKKDSEEQK